jgi:hypothetical protein
MFKWKLCPFEWKLCPLRVEALSLLSGSFVHYIHNNTIIGKMALPFAIVKRGVSG